jgi:hypothetical protein
VKFGYAVSHFLWSKICPNLPKNCQNLPRDNLFKKLWNSTKIWDFGYFQKKKLPYIEGHQSMSTPFQSKNFPYAFFNVKNGLCMWISAYLFVQKWHFSKVPYVLWIWDFVDMYLTHLGTRIWSPSIHTYSKKWFFWPPNSVVPLKHKEKRFFFQLWIL